MRQNFKALRASLDEESPMLRSENGLPAAPAEIEAYEAARKRRAAFAAAAYREEPQPRINPSPAAVVAPAPAPAPPPMLAPDGRPAPDFGVKSLKRISHAVSEYYGLTSAELVSARRTKSVVRCRWVAFHLAKLLTPCSLPMIGRAFGDRDHTTVLHGLVKIVPLLESDQSLRNDVNALLVRLAPVP